MAIKLKIGSPVGGDDFFGRRLELVKAEALIEHNNLCWPHQDGLEKHLLPKG